MRTKAPGDAEMQMGPNNEFDRKVNSAGDALDDFSATTPKCESEGE